MRAPSAASSYWLWPRLRHVGLFTHGPAFPEWTERQRRRVIYGLFQSFGRMCRPTTPISPAGIARDIEKLIIQPRVQNYARAQSQGRGVLFLTGRLRQVLINLLGNSLKFTQQGEINLRFEWEAVRKSRITLHFRVKDTGIGIPTEQQAHIFEAFTQVDGSTACCFGGTGSGPTICRQLVTVMEAESGRKRPRPRKHAPFHGQLRHCQGRGADEKPLASRRLGTPSTGPTKAFWSKRL